MEGIVQEGGYLLKRNKILFKQIKGEMLKNLKSYLKGRRKRKKDRARLKNNCLMTWLDSDCFDGASQLVWGLSPPP